jgi:hypothetical protein
MMVRLNKTKPEDYMRPLDVPAAENETPMPARLKHPVNPGGLAPREFESRPVHHRALLVVPGRVNQSDVLISYGN